MLQRVFHFSSYENWLLESTAYRTSESDDYAGPFHDDEGREPIPFPWEKLTGKPLIYASL
jgi:UDP:flavonoid glycosyltransferase YjiC (YdhE family)